jgi:hypothetical protein
LGACFASEVKVRRGLLSGCLFGAFNVLIVLGGLAVIVSLYKSAHDTSEANIAPPPLAAQASIDEPAAAPPGTIQKAQDRLGPSEQAPAANLRRWRTEIERPAANGSPDAAQGGLWRYGEAKLRLDAFGRARRFHFVEARRDIPARPGDLAFDGVREGPTYSGLAFAYAQGCEPLSYQVRGAISPDEGAITLGGREPRRDARCNIVGAADRELVFNHMGAAQKSARASAAWTPQAD